MLLQEPLGGKERTIDPLRNAFLRVRFLLAEITIPPADYAVRSLKGVSQPE